MRRSLCFFVVLFNSVFLLSSLHAQQTASVGLPDAPAAQAAASSGAAPQTAGGNQQDKRILGIFPNFRDVGTDTHLPPQSVKEKFVTASQDSFDYSSFVLQALLAGEQQATNATPEFHQGGAGYGRYFWHSLVDQTSENYFVEFIVPTITREDTRYYALGKRRQRAWKRAGYAMSRTVITRSDSGREVFNAGEIVGAGIDAGVSNLYYPAPERTVGNTLDKYATNAGIDAFFFLVREFWPDANHILFRGPDPRLVP